jgi:ribosomal protein L15
MAKLVKLIKLMSTEYPGAREKIEAAGGNVEIINPQAGE